MTHPALLHPADCGVFAALQAGRAPIGIARLADSPLADPAVLAMLAGLAEQIATGFTPAAWVVVDQGCAAGLISLVKHPAARAVTIGYGIAPTHRRRGLATRAVAAIAAWARADPRVDAVLADTGVDNLPSQRVLRACGFVQESMRIDPEDGQLLCWRLGTATAPVN